MAGFLTGEILALRAEGAPHLTLKILLFIGEQVGLAGEIFNLILGLTGADAGERLGGLIEAIGRTAGVGLALGRAGLLGGRGVAHILESLLQIVEGILEALLIGAAEACLSELSLLIHLAALLLLLALLAGLLTALLATLLTLPARLTRLTRLTGLTRLAGLAGLALLTLLALLPLLSLLSLLALLRRTVAAQAGGLLQLLAKLLGFAAQHFLLPSLLGSLLLALVLLFGELLLAPG